MSYGFHFSHTVCIKEIILTGFFLLWFGLIFVANCVHSFSIIYQDIVISTISFSSSISQIQRSSYVKKGSLSGITTILDSIGRKRVFNFLAHKNEANVQTSTFQWIFEFAFDFGLPHSTSIFCFNTKLMLPNVSKMLNFLTINSTASQVLSR